MQICLKGKDNKKFFNYTNGEERKRPQRMEEFFTINNLVERKTIKNGVIVH